MKKVIIGLIALFVTSTASAFEFEGSIGGVSNYVWRGATQTAGNAAIQGSIGIEHGGLYANAWGSQVDYNDDIDAEVDLTVGYSNDIKMLSYDVGYIRYSYIGDDVDFGDDAQEIYFGLALGPISGTIYRDIDNDSNYYAGALSVNDIVELPIDISGFIGRNADSNMDAGVTIGKNIKGFDVGYTYTWSEEDIEDSTHSVGIFYTF
tara:strand:+ start:203 stop:820 length:618 start_codon:yes stop_codon:yes gene_type:complete